MVRILQEIEPKIKIGKNLDALAAKYGVFLNEHTLEMTLFQSGRAKSMGQTLIELSDSDACHQRAKAWRNKPESMEPERLLRDILQIGKDRFAQRLATNMRSQSH